MTNVTEIKKIMVDRGCKSISELSMLTGITRRTLGDFLSGKEQPSSATMYAVVKALDIPPQKAGEIFFENNLRNM